MQEMIKDAINMSPNSIYLPLNFINKYVTINTDFDNFEARKRQEKELQEFYKEANELNEWAEHIIKMEV